MHIGRVLGLSALLLGASVAADAAPVLMISVDGLRPGDVLDAKARGFSVPNLTALADGGAYASGVRNVLPTITYPDHTTLITGVWPIRHGIPGNVTFDPLQKNMSGWYWYARDIKVETLWDAVHAAHGKVASLSWPVSVDAPSIDENVPEYWRANVDDEDAKLLHALSTRGLPEKLEKATHTPFAKTIGEGIDQDLERLRQAGALIASDHPTLLTIHLRGLDETEHDTAPGSKESIAALARLDAGIGALVAEARKAQPDLVVAVVSDHGFAPVSQDINLVPAFVQAGLITLDPKTHKVTAWKAEPWGGASAAVVLADPNDEATKAQVKALLDKLAADPTYQIAHVSDAAEIAKLGGTGMASFWIDFKLGAKMSGDPNAPVESPSANKGTHGYLPTHPEMRATFILNGKSVAKKGSLGDIDMRDIAPTLARIMGVTLPHADGKPLL
jgi:predicted AlkP superfamily pyrophosphatase or phosphodiesterase